MSLLGYYLIDVDDGSNDDDNVDDDSMSSGQTVGQPRLKVIACAQVKF